jgi:hypothetical protein
MSVSARFLGSFSDAFISNVPGSASNEGGRPVLLDDAGDHREVAAKPTADVSVHTTGRETAAGHEHSEDKTVEEARSEIVRLTAFTVHDSTR